MQSSCSIINVSSKAVNRKTSLDDINTVLEHTSKCALAVGKALNAYMMYIYNFKYLTE